MKGQRHSSMPPTDLKMQMLILKLFTMLTERKQRLDLG